METKPVLHEAITNPQVEAYLTNLENELNDFSEIQGKEDGKKTTELTEVVFKITVVDPVHSKVQMAIDYIRKNLLSTSVILGAVETEQAAQKKMQANNNDINEKKHKTAPLKRKLASIKIDPQKKKYANWLILIALFVGIADAALAYGSFRHGSYTALQALVAATAIGVVIAFSHWIYAGWIKQAANSRQRVFRIFIVLTLAFIFFAWLGNLRASTANNTVDIALNGNDVVASSTPILNGWAVAVISFFLFSAVFFLAILFWRSSKERLEEQEYNRLKAEMLKIENEIKTLEKENIEIEDNTLTLKQEARKIYDYATSSIRRAKNIGVNAIAKYKQVYALHNNIVPEFFKHSDDNVYEESFHFPKLQNTEHI